MGALTAAQSVLTWLSEDIEKTFLAPVDAQANAGGGLIYAGGFVGLNGALGMHRRFQANDVCIGVALRSADNSGAGTPLGFAGGNIGDGTAGSIKVPLKVQGRFLWRGPITGLAATVAAEKTKVYCIDDGTLTTAAGGGANGEVGTVECYDVDLAAFVVKLIGAIELNV